MTLTREPDGTVSIIVHCLESDHLGDGVIENTQLTDYAALGTVVCNDWQAACEKLNDFTISGTEVEPGVVTIEANFYIGADLVVKYTGLGKGDPFDAVNGSGFEWR